MLRRRHRHGPYPLATERSPMIVAVWGGAALLGVLLALWAGSALMSSLDIGNAIRREAVVLTIPDRGIVNITLEGGEARPTDGEIKMYPGESVKTDRGSPAFLTFFDGTIIRLNRGSSLTIDESAFGQKRSTLRFALDQGEAWIKTPSTASFSGSIQRTAALGTLDADIPSDTEASLTPSGVTVYAADGLGITLTLPETSEEIAIGEGQQFALPPDGTVSGDPYAYRSSLAGSVVASPFVLESRLVAGEQTEGGGTAVPGVTSALEVTAPDDGATVNTATVLVTGRVDAAVARVRINGYNAPIDPEDRSFSLEIALPEAEQVAITVEAMTEGGETIGRVLRTLQRDRTPPGMPTITAPAGNGQTYRTTRTELEIRGTVPQGTAAVIVNDYRLQLFSTGDTNWSYLASTRLENFSEGENIFRVVAVNEAGMRSEPAILTLILGEGTEGVVSGGGSSAGAAPEDEQPDPSTLPTNAPLRPGTLSITAPTAGTEHSGTLAAEGTEYLIEGNVPEGTASMWVNDYMLRLFEPGKTFFNYIASTGLGTLKEGRNVYVIVARDEDQKIIDRVEYVITMTKN